MTQYARIEEKFAYLSNDFGESMARRYFGDEFVNDLPRYVRGNRKGQIKGFIKWDKVVEGGWIGSGSSMQGAEGSVENRKGSVIKVSAYEAVWGDADKLLAAWNWSDRSLSRDEVLPRFVEEVK